MAALGVAPTPAPNTTTTATATTTAVTQPSAFTFASTSRNTSPLSSAAGTPTGASPTSPRHPHGFTSPPAPPRQLRPPKCPLYVPAVLRPTERPQRLGVKRESSGGATTRTSSLPITPPYSAGGSFEDASNVPGDASLDSLSRRVMGEIGPLTGVSRVITDEWVEEKMEDVTGYPTRDHWKPDSSSPTCNAPVCGETFNMFVRRHHCRRCGNIFCATHSTRAVPLDQHARFHPDGALGRACETCFADFQAWNRARRRSRTDSGTGSVAGTGGSNSSDSSGSGTSTPTAVKTGADVSAVAIADSAAKKGPTPIIGSLSRDWSWSTF